MNAPNRLVDSSAFQLTREQTADLLYRYPHVSEAEAKSILTFLRKGRHLDVGMLTGDERLKPYLDRFTADHAKHFRVGFGEASAVATALAAVLVACWLIWEAVKPAAHAA